MSAETGSDPCVVCTLNSASTLPSTGDTIRQRCRRCGEFSVTSSAASSLSRLALPRRVKLANVIRRTQIFGGRVEIHSRNVERFLELPEGNALELADDVLMFLSQRVTKFSHLIDPADWLWDIRALIFATNDLDHFTVINDLLVEPGFLKPIGKDKVRYRITREGYLRLTELQKRNIDSSQVFVAMWFGAKDHRQEMDEAFEQGLQIGISRAGYRPLRVDKGEYNGKIDDEIIRQIRRSRFVVADFTGHAAGVYYEAGFAEGFGLPIIQTCREDNVSGLHFDNRQVNTITWSSASDLADKLHKRIEGTIGKGPLQASR